MRWFLAVLFTTGAAFAAGQNASLPDGEGKALVTAACASCHGLDLITGKQASKADWASVVDRMKGYGTTLDTAQTTTMVDYLAASFPPKGAAPAPAAAPQAGASDDEMKALVAAACTTCHGADLITSKKGTRAEWQETVERMRGYGTTLTAAQATAMVDYFARTYGTAPATASSATASADPGKVTLDGYCGTCHDLDLVSGRKGTKAEWQDIVERMNARGSGVPEKEIAPLVEYLAKTYGTK